MATRRFLSRTDYQAEVDAHFEAVLKACGFNSDGTPKTDPKEVCDPAVGPGGDPKPSSSGVPGSLNANLVRQMEFFSVKRTSAGLVFEMLITEK